MQLFDVLRIRLFRFFVCSKAVGQEGMCGVRVQTTAMNAAAGGTIPAPQSSSRKRHDIRPGVARDH